MSKKRFIPFSKIKYKTALSSYEVKKISATKRLSPQEGGIHWKGIPLIKDPFSISLYQMLIWDLKPKSVVEFGTLYGGSALWIKDLCDSYELDTKVITVDSNPERILKKHPNIEYLKLDLTYDDLSLCHTLKDLPSPILFIEDAHAGLERTLRFCFNLMRPRRDYLILEDTLSLRKYTQFKNYLNKNDIQEKVLVDTMYTNRFGHNFTWNLNGFLVLDETISL